MQILDIPPGPAVGQAWQYLKQLRMEHGPLDHDRAVEELTRWWAQQQALSVRRGRRVRRA